MWKCKQNQPFPPQVALAIVLFHSNQDPKTPPMHYSKPKQALGLNQANGIIRWAAEVCCPIGFCTWSGPESSSIFYCCLKIFEKKKLKQGSTPIVLRSSQQMLQQISDENSTSAKPKGVHQVPKACLQLRWWPPLGLAGWR